MESIECAEHVRQSTQRFAQSRKISRGSSTSRRPTCKTLEVANAVEGLPEAFTTSSVSREDVDGVVSVANRRDLT